VVIAGGQGISTNTVLAETWSWDGSAWTRQLDMPAARVDAAMAYDSARGRMVLFGGYQSGGVLTATDTTFAYDGTRWTTLSIPVSPSARAASSMTFDARRGRMVLFGGVNSGTVPAQTWELEGDSWLASNTGSEPAARADAGLVYDSLRNRVVMFGGTASDPAVSFLGAGGVRIVSEPVPVSITAGQTFSLGVAATTSSGIVTYRWRKNGVPIPFGGNAQGVNSDILTITNASLSDAGSYDVVVSGSNCGTAVSRGAAVQISPCYANCDNSTVAPVLNAADFSCFLTKFRAGCP
jgi:hypothetical protein